MKHGIILTIGTFDGVHKGHKAIISFVLDKAHLLNCKPVVLALERPARSIINNSLHDLLTPWDEKVRRLKDSGIFHVEKMKFNARFRELTPKEFVRSYLMERWKISGIVVGEDFRFGKNRQGNPAVLKKLLKPYGVDVWTLKKKKLCGQVISSSLIRHMIMSGDIRQANTMLGYPYLIEGSVLHGLGLGSNIGFPTINIKADEHKMLPSGVFAARLLHGGKAYKAACNIGFRPTIIVHQPEKSIELHVIDPMRSYRMLSARFELIDKIRDERKFRSLESLQLQISRDVAITLGKANSW